ncbi:MAG TPA: SCO family protein [Bacteroidota bacterium]|nr:SCO family protein [Bacteroidota bacterium]
MEARSYTGKRKLIFLVLFLAAAGLAALQLWQRYQRQFPALPDLGTVPAFSLATEDRRTFTQRDFLQKVTIADFVFTTCAGPCPIMSAQMQHLQGELGGNPQLQLVSFSVDPETDTPKVLAEYASRFGAIKGKWMFLTGSKETIYEVTRNGFHLAIDDDENAIAHSTKFVLVDKEAKIRGYYDSEDQESLKKLIEDAKRLMHD